MEDDSWPPQIEGRDTYLPNPDGEVAKLEVIVDGLFYRVKLTRHGLVEVSYKPHHLDETGEALISRQDFMDRIRRAHSAWSGNEHMASITPRIVGLGEGGSVWLDLGMKIEYVLGDSPIAHTLVSRNDQGDTLVTNPVVTLFETLEKASFNPGEYPDLACITEANIVVDPDGNLKFLFFMVDPELTKEEFDTFLKSEKPRWLQTYG